MEIRNTLINPAFSRTAQDTQAPIRAERTQSVENNEGNAGNQSRPGFLENQSRSRPLERVQAVTESDDISPSAREALETYQETQFNALAFEEQPEAGELVGVDLFA